MLKGAKLEIHAESPQGVLSAKLSEPTNLQTIPVRMIPRSYIEKTNSHAANYFRPLFKSLGDHAIIVKAEAFEGDRLIEEGVDLFLEKFGEAERDGKAHLRKSTLCLVLGMAFFIAGGVLR